MTKQAREVLGQVMTAISPDDAAWPEGGEKAVEYIDTALTAERERCAREAERIGSKVDATSQQWARPEVAAHASTVIKTADDCAAAIRELGEDR